MQTRGQGGQGLSFELPLGGWVLFGLENTKGASNKSGSSQWACQLKYFRGLSEGTPDHESYWKRKIFSRAPSQSKPLPHQRSSPHPKRIKKDGPWSPSTCNRELTGQSVPYSSWCKPGAKGGKAYVLIRILSRKYGTTFMQIGLNRTSG